MSNCYRLRRSNTSSRLYSVIIQSESGQEERKKMRKEAGERATYGSAFGRGLTEAQADAYRIEEEEKAEKS